VGARLRPPAAAAGPLEGAPRAAAGRPELAEPPTAGEPRAESGPGRPGDAARDAAGRAATKSGGTEAVGRGVPAGRSEARSANPVALAPAVRRAEAGGEGLTGRPDEVAAAPRWPGAERRGGSPERDRGRGAAAGPETDGPSALAGPRGDDVPGPPTRGLGAVGKRPAAPERPRPDAPARRETAAAERGHGPEGSSRQPDARGEGRSGPAPGERTGPAGAARATASAPGRTAPTAPGTTDAATLREAVPLAALRRAEAEAAAPTIRVTIGRLEVRAATTPAPPPARRSAPLAAPGMSLEEYLRRREGGRA
jgi:hypothetical protein